MALPIYENTVTNDSGDVQPSAEVTVYDESSGLKATIYNHRDGGVPNLKDNPFITSEKGLVQFYAEPGEYRVEAVTGSGTVTKRFQRLANFGEEPKDTPQNKNILAAASDFLEYNGTNPNSIVLTRSYGTKITALTLGQKIRFWATVTNTAAVEATIDDIETAIPLKTKAGDDLETGYLKTDEPTECVFNGTNLVVKREEQTNLLAYDATSTANAIVLTTPHGTKRTSLIVGEILTFWVTTTNTDATTITIDSIGTFDAKTATGKDTPKGYFRTDVPTQSYWDGTNFICHRAVESGKVDLTGERWTKFETGRMTREIRHNIGSRTTNGTGLYTDPYRTSVWEWEFEEDFSSPPSVTGTGEIYTSAAAARVNSVTVGEVTVSSARSIQSGALSGHSEDVDVILNMKADGDWYERGSQ